MLGQQFLHNLNVGSFYRGTFGYVGQSQSILRISHFDFYLCLISYIDYKKNY